MATFTKALESQAMSDCSAVRRMTRLSAGELGPHHGAAATNGPRLWRSPAAAACARRTVELSRPVVWVTRCGWSFRHSRSPENLREDEKKALSLWLNSQTTPELTPEDERRLLQSLDEAIRDVDAGMGVPIEDVRKRVRSWAGK